MCEAIINVVKKWGCCHRWKIWNVIEVENNHRNYFIYHFVCTKCGKFKQIKSC